MKCTALFFFKDSMSVLGTYNRTYVANCLIAIDISIATLAIRIICIILLLCMELAS